MLCIFVVNYMMIHLVIVHVIANHASWCTHYGPVFGVLWSDGVDSEASSRFHMGISELLLMVRIVIWSALVLWWGFRNEMDMCCP